MSGRRRVSILGATGSIGSSTLDVISSCSDRFAVSALTAGRDASALADAALRSGASFAALADEGGRGVLSDRLSGSGIRWGVGSSSLLEAATLDSDVVVSAISGSAGLAPTLAAAESGRVVALANKESLVCGGRLVTEASSRSGGRILPVDSEHSAIFQSLGGGMDSSRFDGVERLVLTASGGPFLSSSWSRMRDATPAEALRHPTWSMGSKVSVDSATLMNKGLELIEAHHLFPVGLDRIDILIHPQSIVHGLAEYCDGSVVAQLSCPDMRSPIAYALSWPDRILTSVRRLRLEELGTLHFSSVDEEKFPSPGLCRYAIERGGCAPAVLNGANESAVEMFLSGRIRLTDVSSLVASVLDRSERDGMSGGGDSLESVLAADGYGRRMASECLEVLS